MKAQKLCMLASALSAAILSMGTAQAADVTTEDVKVTASRVEKELMDVNMSVSVVTAEEIARSEARTIGELLKDIPGVRINNDGGQGIKRVGIRGENAFHTLVMIDGQKIAEHKSMSGSPMLIDPSMVERIEVIKGPASVLYGSDAIGGAINIITKKGGGVKKPSRRMSLLAETPLQMAPRLRLRSQGRRMAGTIAWALPMKRATSSARPSAISMEPALNPSRPIFSLLTTSMKTIRSASPLTILTTNSIPST